MVKFYVTKLYITCSDIILLLGNFSKRCFNFPLGSIIEMKFVFRCSQKWSKFFLPCSPLQGMINHKSWSWLAISNSKFVLIWCPVFTITSVLIARISAWDSVSAIRVSFGVHMYYTHFECNVSHQCLMHP